MPTFTYQIRNQSGKKIAATVEAVSEKALADQLARSGYLVTSIKEAGASSLRSSRVRRVSGIRASHLTMFYFQLGNMLEAGVPLLAALRAVYAQSSSQKMKQVALFLASQVEEGVSFSDALGRYPGIFPELYLAMIRVGETSGNLDVILKQAAELSERSERLRYEIQTALAYPVVLICASTAVVAFMIVWIVPSFSAIFTRAGIPLPLPTRLLYGFSMWVKSNAWVLFGGVFSVGLGLWLALRLEGFKYRWDILWLSCPVIGPLIRQVEVSLWARNVALMRASGIPILKTLEMTGKLVASLPFRRVLRRAYLGVQAGGKLADTLDGRIFPPDVVQMIRTGETTGALEKMLGKAADFYDALVTRSLRQLTSAIEPVFILLMGVIVGFIMLSIFLPIFDMLKVFSS